jgi:hypothetical protein
MGRLSKTFGLIAIMTILAGCQHPKSKVASLTAKTKPHFLKPDKNGWYDVPFGTSVSDLGVMVPGTYRADPDIRGLKLIRELSADQQSKFTGQIHLYLPKRYAENRTYKFLNGKLIPDPMEEGQVQTDIENGRKPWKRVGNTISELAKNIPADGDLRFYIPISEGDIITLPKDAHLLTHFTGSLNHDSPYPQALFDLKNGFAVACRFAECQTGPTNWSEMRHSSSKSDVNLATKTSFRVSHLHQTEVIRT